MTFTPTDEQVAIVDDARNTNDNLLCHARAGAAKTSTLVLIAEALPSTPILSLAFNKDIATEMKARLPENCRAMTINGLGHKAWMQFISARVKVDTGKCYGMLKAQIEALPQPDRSEAYKHMADTLQAIRLSKHYGFLPASFRGYWKPLMNEEEFFYSEDSPLEFSPTALQEELICTVAKKSFQAALQGHIDFDDQILCPALCPVSFEFFPLTLVDEAQDLSSINHVILKKLVRLNRIIAVGDPCQAIYSFRGADEDSMTNLRRMFSMKERYLTMTFRCSQAVTKEALWRAPDMRCPEWAKPGAVQRLASWSNESIPDHAAIICRNNAPLFSVAIKLLRAGRYPELVGRDVVKGLVKIMKKLGKPTLAAPLVHDAIDRWEEEELNRTRVPGRVRDQAACIHIFAEQAEDLGGAIAYAEHVAQISGHIKLMTGHKSKGLEFDEVFFLDPQIIGNKGQDPNVRYVIQTRAKEKLTYVESKGWSD